MSNYPDFRIGPLSIVNLDNVARPLESVKA